MKFISLDNAAGIFNGYVSKKFKNHSDAAKHYKVSRQYISQIMLGLRPMNKKMAEDIGVKKVRGFVSIA